MKMNMKQWLADMLAAPVKKAMPVLSFPAIQLMGISVKDLISSSSAQAEGMKKIADRVDAAASVSLMDLSVEAECFGSQVRFSDDEGSHGGGKLLSPKKRPALEVPKVGACRTQIYIDAIEEAVKRITDRPVFAA